jgi:hypothetical protein
MTHREYFPELTWANSSLNYLLQPPVFRSCDAKDCSLGDPWCVLAGGVRKRTTEQAVVERVHVATGVVAKHAWSATVKIRE